MTAMIEQGLDWLAGVMPLLLRSSWQAAVMAGLVVAAQWALGGRLSQGWRCGLWWLVLARLALPVAPGSAVSVHNVWGWVMEERAGLAGPPRQGEGEGNGRFLPPVGAPAALGEALAEAVELGEGGSAEPAPQLASPVEVAGNVQAAGGWRVVDPWKIAGVVWLVGVVAVGARVGVTSIRLGRLARRLEGVGDEAVLRLLEGCKEEMGVRRRVGLLTGAGLGAPALMGVLRPRILVPKEVLGAFGEGELRLVFLHELAHLVRRDLAMNWIMSALSAAHWFNPVMWLAMARVRNDRELACDERVLRMTGAGERRRYGETMIRLLQTLSRQRGLPGMVGILEGTHPMRRRMTMIAAFSNKRRWSSVAVVTALALGAVALTDRAGGGEEREKAEAKVERREGEGPEKSLVERLRERRERERGVADSLEARRRESREKGTPAGGAEMERIEAALRKPIPEAKLENVQLEDAIAAMRGMSGLNIFVDWKSLESVGVDRNATVSLELRNVTTETALKLLLRSMSPEAGFEVEDGVVVIGVARERKEVGERKQGGEERKAQLDAMRSHIATLHAQIEERKAELAKLKQEGKDAAAQAAEKMLDTLQAMVSQSERALDEAAARVKATREGEARVAPSPAPPSGERSVPQPPGAGPMGGRMPGAGGGGRYGGAGGYQGEGGGGGGGYGGIGGYQGGGFGGFGPAVPARTILTRVYDVSSLLGGGVAGEDRAAQMRQMNQARERVGKELEEQRKTRGEAHASVRALAAELEAVERQLDALHAMPDPGSRDAKLKTLVDLVESVIEAEMQIRPVVKAFNGKIVVAGDERTHKKVQEVLELLREQAPPKK